MIKERKQKVILKFETVHEIHSMQIRTILATNDKRVHKLIKKIIQTENVICQFFICSTNSQISLNTRE